MYTVNLQKFYFFPLSYCNKVLAHRWKQVWVGSIFFFSVKDKMDVSQTENESSCVLCEKVKTVDLGRAFLTPGHCWLAKKPTNQRTEPTYVNS